MERIDYFALHVEVSSCWEWTALKTVDGYGRFWDGNRMVMAYRWLYEYVYDVAIPEKYTIDHLCKNPSCVNPDHLEAVTQGENNRRGVGNLTHRLRLAKRTHCKRGHELTFSNTYNARNSDLNCKTCRQGYAREQYLKRRARLAEQGLTVRQYQHMSQEDYDMFLNVTAVA